MTIDIEGFVPPENIYYEIHGRIRKRHDSEMGDRNVLNDLVHYEPRHLNQDNGFRNSEPVATCSQ